MCVFTFSSFLQIRYSGFPKNVKTLSDKENYCQNMNRKMDFFHPDLALTCSNVSDNRQLRDAFKLGSNSLLGKLSQDSDQDIKVNVNNQDALDQLFYNVDTEITQIVPVAATVMEVKLKRKAGFNRPNLKGNVILGAYVTASARIEMFKHFRQCLEGGCDILYTGEDTVAHFDDNDGTDDNTRTFLISCRHGQSHFERTSHVSTAHSHRKCLWRVEA